MLPGTEKVASGGSQIVLDDRNATNTERERIDKTITLLRALLQQVHNDEDTAQLHFDLAILLSKRGDDAGALQAIHHAFQRRPDSLPIARAYRKMAIRSDDALKTVAALQAEARILGSGPYAAALHVERARVLEQRLKQGQAARLAYRDALDDDPSHVGVLFAMAESAQIDRDNSAAAQTLEDLSNVVTDPVLGGELRGRAVLCLQAAGDDSTAYLHAVSARVHAPSSLSVQYALEKLYVGREEYAELCDFREAQIAAGTIDARQGWFDIGVIARYRLRDSELATKAFQNAAELAGGKCVSSLAELSRLAEQHEEWPRWVELMRQRTPLELDSRSRAHLWFRVGHTLEVRMRDHDQALVAYQQALTDHPQYVPALESLGRLLYPSAGVGQLVELHMLDAKIAPTAEERAAAEVRAARLLIASPATVHDGITLLRSVLQVVPSDHAAIEALAEALVRTGQWGELIQIYETDLKTADSSRRGWLLYEIAGIAADKIGDRKLAIAALEQIDDHHEGGIPRALQRLASLLEQEQEWERLAVVLEKMLDHVDDPRRLATLLERLAGIHEQLGNHDRALDLYGQAANAAPPGHSALAAAARAYLIAERFDDLALIYDRASEGPPARRAFWRTKRALLMASQDRRSSAIEDLRSALEADPSYSFARKTLEELLTADEQWADLATVLANDPDVADKGQRALRLGMLAEAEGEDTKALKCYAEAVAAGVELATWPYLRLAGVAAKEHAAPAERVYAAMQGSKPVVLHARYRAGEIASRRPDGRADAIAHYDEALAIGPHDLGVLFALLPLLHDRPERQDDLLGRMAAVVNDPAMQAAVELRRAELIATRDPERALAIRRATLESAPMHPVNSVIVELALESSGDRAGLVRLLKAQSNDSMLEPELRTSTLCALGSVLEELGHARDAADAFENACHATLAPSWLALMALPRIYGGMQNVPAYTDSLQRLADRLPTGPERAMCLEVVAGVFMRLGEPHKAMDALEDALSVDASHYSALRELERLCREAGDVSRYVDALSRCFELAEAGPAIRALGTTLAAELVREQRFESAFDALERVTANEPDDLRTLLLRADIERGLEVWDRADVALEALLEHPEVPPVIRAEAFRRLAEILDVRFGDVARLEELARKITDQELGTTLFARVALDIYDRAGHHESVANVLRRLVEASELSSEERSEHLIRLASIQDAELDDPAAAIETLARVTDASRQSDAIKRLLELGERSGRWDLASRALETALERGKGMDPTWELAIRRRLAGLLEGPLNRAKDASRQYARIAELDRSDAQSLERLAALEEARDPTTALDVHRSLLAIDPGRVASYRHMRSLFLALDDVDGAFCAESVLVGLGEANEEEDYFHRQRLASLRDGNQLPLDDGELDALCPERNDVVLALLEHVQGFLHRVFPGDLSGHGVDASGASASPELRQAAAGMSSVFGLPNHVVAPVADRLGPTVELADKPILLVPRSMEGDTRRFQRVVFACLFGRLRFRGVATDQRRLNPLSPRHLEYVLWATCALVRESVKVPDENAIYKDIKRRVAEALTPTIRGTLGDVVDRVVATPDTISGDRIAKISNAAATRCGLFASGDPAEAISTLNKLEESLALDPKAHLAFVVSKEHLTLRKRRGWEVKS